MAFKLDKSFLLSVLVILTPVLFFSALVSLFIFESGAALMLGSAVLSSITFQTTSYIPICLMGELFYLSFSSSFNSYSLFKSSTPYCMTQSILFFSSGSTNLSGCFFQDFNIYSLQDEPPKGFSGSPFYLFRFSSELLGFRLSGTLLTCL